MMGAYVPPTRQFLQEPHGSNLMQHRSFENMSPYKYLGTTIKSENMIQETIKNRLHCGNASYHSIHNFLSTCLLSKNVTTRI
jgi:hypothetical protein